MQNTNNPVDECFLELSRQISNAHQNVSRLSFKKEIHKFWEKLKQGESLKQYQTILIRYLNNGIAIQQNHKLNTQQQIITILLSFFEVEQPQVSESHSLCEKIVDYIKFLIKQQYSDEYIQKQFINLINVILWKRKIFQIPSIDIKDIEIIDQNFSLINIVIAFSNKTLQQAMKNSVLSISELPEYLLKLQYSEIVPMILEMTSLNFTFPQNILNRNFNLESGIKYILLPADQQILIFLNQQQWSDEQLDLITQFIFQNTSIDLSQYVPKLIDIIANSKNIDFDRSILILKKISKGLKYQLNYETLRNILIQTKNKQLSNFIIDVIKEFETQQDQIIKLEISKQTIPINIIYLIISLIKNDSIEELYEKLLNKSILPYQYIILHISIIIKDYIPNLEQLQEQCLRFQLNEIGLIQLFSLYSFHNLNPKRKAKLLQQFQILIDNDEQKSFYDILVVIGIETTQEPVINQKIGQILNREWNNISSFLKQISYSRQSLLIQGFSQVVIFFKDQNESEFSRLFEIIRKSMSAYNKSLNYGMLKQAIQIFELGKIESEIQLYVYLLKINYLLQDNLQNKKKNGEEISERSSEAFADLNEEQEKTLFLELQEHGAKLIEKLENKLKFIEIIQLGRQENCYLAIQISRLLQLSEVKINIQHSLLRDEKALILLNEPNLQESAIIWESLMNKQKVQFATSIIQLFKNEKNAKIIKMIIVELSKFCKYKYYALLWKQYDILNIQQNIQQQITNFTKLQMLVQKYQLIIQIQDDFEFLKLSYQQVQKSQLEQLGLLVAISLHCGINYNLIDGLGKVNDMCINKLIVGFSNAGLLQLVLTLVKPPKQQRKKKQQMDVEKKIEDYLSNSLTEIVNIVASNIYKNLNKNQDLKQEFINLAIKVYSYGQASEYQLIFDLFDKIPYELILSCLKSIKVDDQYLDQKLNHIMALINKFVDKNLLTTEFYELSYNVIINNQTISQTMIEYCLQIINLIKINETGQSQQQQAVVDVNQLKETLIPENFVAQGCTQQNTRQEMFTCIACQNNNKQNLQCCANCAFSCHLNHNIQYDSLTEAACECNQTRKCNQQRRQQQFNQGIKRSIYLSSNRDSSALGVADYLRETELRREREFKTFRELRFAQLQEFSSQLKVNIKDVDSDIELDDSISSSQIQLPQEDSNIEIIEKFESSSASIIEIEPNQFEAREAKTSPKIQQDSQFFSKLKIDYEKLFDKMIQMCNQALNRYKMDKKGSVEEEEEFQLTISQQLQIQKVNIISQSDNIILHKAEHIDVVTDVRHYQEIMQQNLRNLHQYFVPFQIRKIIDEGEEFMALAAGSEIKVLNCNKYFQSIEKKTNNLPLSSIKQRFEKQQPILSINFNPQNKKQLIISSFQEIHLLDLKQDGTQQSEKVIISQFPHPISKTVWVNQNSISWLAVNSIYVYNLSQSTQQQQCYNLSFDEKKIKDFCIMKNFILCVDFQGDIYCQRIVECQQKIYISEKVDLDDFLKGKSRDKTAYCLTKIQNTQILLISYKNGASFLCNFEDKKFINIVRLDELLISQGFDGLLASPQLISQTKNYIRFTVLAQKQNLANKSVNFHYGNLLYIEINNQGNFQVQQLYDIQIEGYSLVKNLENNFFILAATSDKQLITINLGLKDQNGKKINEKKNENVEQLMNSLKERFDLNLLKQSISQFPPLQNFCLQPSTVATPQQLQIGPTSVTVTQGYAITGLIFHKTNVDNIEIFKYRTVQKRSNNSIVIPLNYIEQIYTYLHHTITFSQNNCQNVQVYIQKMQLSQPLMIKILSILNQESNMSKGYVYQDVIKRNNKLKSLFSEQQLNLINSLDALGITLQAYQNPKIQFSLIPSLVELIQQKKQPTIIDSAKKLLKIMLKNHKALLGSEYDYKSIKDKILIENLKNKTTQHGIVKLLKIANNRLPQLFYIFNQLPQIMIDILSETCNYKAYCQVLMRYLQFLQNCQKEINQCLSQIEDIKQTWKLANQNVYNKMFIEELILFQKNSKTEAFDYAWDVFVQDQNNIDRIEIESFEEKSSDFNIEDLVNDNLDDYDLYDIQQFKQEIQQSQLKYKQQKVQTNSQFPKPKPAQKLVVNSYDLLKAYSKWLQKNITYYNNNFQKGRKEFQYLVQLSYQFYNLTKSTQNIDILIDYLQYIEFKNKSTQSLILLAFMNGKNQKDVFWQTKNKYKLFLSIEALHQYLSHLELSDSNANRSKSKNLPLDKFRDILKSDNEQQYQIIMGILERRNILIYLEIMKYLLNAARLNAEIAQQLSTDSWTQLICQLKFNQNSKQISTPYLKQLFQHIIAKEDYHQVKDKILYQYLMKELAKSPKQYSNRQQIYSALNRIQKTSKKRPDNWKTFCDISVMEKIKSLIKLFPKETLEIIEFII